MIQTPKVAHRAVKICELEIFYREAGPKDAPTVLLVHAFPTSSQMFRNLIPRLADHYRMLAPDYPGFGHSSVPPRDTFAYTFDNLAKVVDEFNQLLSLSSYALYVQDYGAPIGYRLATRQTKTQIIGDDYDPDPANARGWHRYGSSRYDCDPPRGREGDPAFPAGYRREVGWERRQGDG